MDVSKCHRIPNVFYPIRYSLLSNPYKVLWIESGSTSFIDTLLVRSVSFFKTSSHLHCGILSDFRRRTPQTFRYNFLLQDHFPCCSLIHPSKSSLPDLPYAHKYPLIDIKWRPISDPPSSSTFSMSQQRQVYTRAITTDLARRCRSSSDRRNSTFIVCTGIQSPLHQPERTILPTGYNHLWMAELPLATMWIGGMQAHHQASWDQSDRFWTEWLLRQPRSITSMSRTQELQVVTRHKNAGTGTLSDSIFGTIAHPYP